eukprot:3327483-Rhodomonas_salina.1
MSGTDILVAHCATGQVVWNTRTLMAYPGTTLCTMPGTDTAYGATTHYALARAYGSWLRASGLVVLSVEGMGR